MNQEDLITKTAEYVRATLHSEGSGHDWWHVYRVWRTAKTICKTENADNAVVELAALLHDIADWKAYDGDETVGPRVAGDWLRAQDADAKLIADVISIIPAISFKGTPDDKSVLSLEAKIVQDADRLDAIGAIGIARVFSYGGSKGRIIYDPEVKPMEHKTTESYLKNENPSINHFYEKLLLLKDLMNTKTGKEMAQKRHDFMLNYLDTFYAEWGGK